MASRSPYRRRSPQFKLQLCQEIRSGALGRRDAQKKYSLSANLVQLSLTQYDRGEFDGEEIEAVLADYEAKIAFLERKVGQLTMDDLPGYGYRRVTHELQRRGIASHWAEEHQGGRYSE